MRCPQCRFENPDGAAFCSSCGAALRSPAEAATAGTRRLKDGLARTSLILGLASLAHAAPYPTKPVTIIVPFPAGGSSDMIGRVLAQNGIASIDAADGAILSYLPGVAVKANSIELTAKTDIGTAGTRFNVQVDETGTLSGSAGGPGGSVAWATWPGRLRPGPSCRRK